MIIRSILVSLLLFLFYSIMLISLPHLSASQHLWQSNLIRGQRYIFNEQEKNNNAIVGSSMSERFIMDSLPGTDNLSFAGLSVLDGLNLLRHKKILPDTVYIEMNVILRQESENFKSMLFSPIPFFLANHIFSLRADKQPLAIAGKTLIPYCEKYYLKIIGKNIYSIEPTKKASPAFDQLLDIQARNYSEEPAPELIRNQFELLSKQVDYLRSKGTIVIFYEMPVNFKLVKLEKAEAIRNAFYTYFPRKNNVYIDMPDSRDYKTLDGVHLDREESLRYTAYFKKATTKAPLQIP